MSDRTTDARLAELVQDLEPVRRIPPLLVVAVGVVALGGLAFGADWLLGGPGVRRDGAWSLLSYWMALVGLLGIALGATAATLAAAIPGRERTARRGLRVACAGLGVAIAGGLVGVARGAVTPGGEDLAAIASCLTRSVELGLAATILACTFSAYAAVQRPGRAVALALAGGTALGATAVQLSCPSASALHQLLGHVLAPIAATVVASLPVSIWIRRWVRRAR